MSGSLMVDVSFGNTIVARNLQGTEAPEGTGMLVNCATDGIATLTSLDYNLADDATCNFTAPQDLENTDPMLSALGDFGGPTETHELLAGSPAIDTGNPTACPANLRDPRFAS